MNAVLHVLSTVIFSTLLVLLISFSTVAAPPPDIAIHIPLNDALRVHIFCVSTAINDPRICSFAPGDKQENVDPSANIEVTFNQALPNWMNPKFTLTRGDNTNVVGVPNLDNARKFFTFDPLSSLGNSNGFVAHMELTNGPDLKSWQFFTAPAPNSNGSDSSSGTSNGGFQPVIYIIIAAVVAGAGGVGFYFWNRSKSTSKAPSDAGIMDVS